MEPQERRVRPRLDRTGTSGRWWVEAKALVVGAGPVGLTTAIELARRGVAVRIIDAQEGPATSSRALGLHARTLETFEHMGVAEKVISAAQRVSHFSIFQDGRLLSDLELDYEGLGTRFDFSAFIPQERTEEILRDRLATIDEVQVEWGTELLSIVENTTGGVKVKLSHNGTESETEFGWLVGADGGHSRVRKELGLAFDGASDETWMVTDAVVASADLPSGTILMCRHSDGNLMMFPFPEEGKWRILETKVPPEETSEEEVRSSFSRRLQESLGLPSVEVQQLTWVSRFTIQQRMASGLRVGRCFLAGDAAHVHSPASGQGLNTGIQDAFNLAWKLAMVIKGQAPESLLDTYELERRPVSEKLLKSALVATRLVQSMEGMLYHGFGLLTRVQNRVSPLHRRLQKRITQQMTGLTIGYGRCPPQGSRFPILPPEVWKAPAVERLQFFLHRPSLKVLVLGAEAGQFAAELHSRLPHFVEVGFVGEAVEGVVIYPIPDPEAVLAQELLPRGAYLAAWVLRPDGYVLTCQCNTDAKEVETLVKAFTGPQIL